ncbi:MAG: carboxylesterase family protein [Planctomycetota bacterium]|jgi:predicted peptidase
MKIPECPPGVHELQLEPGDRRVTLWIPEGTTLESPRPLITVLHWGGPVLPFTGKSILMGLAEPALGTLGAIMVAPDRTKETWANPESEAEILELLEGIGETYAIDADRTLLTGYSLGGIGSWYVAGRHQDRFTAALPISAAPPAEAVRKEWRIPLYVLHSRHDEIFPLSQTETAVRRLRERGANVELVTVEGITHFDTGGFVGPLSAAVPWIRKVWGSPWGDREGL